MTIQRLKPLRETSVVGQAVLLPRRFFRRQGREDPHLFTAAVGAPVLAFAGLWDRWTDPASGNEVLSAIIIVSGASAWMELYHDRRPVLLGADDADGWLNGSLGPEALKPASESALREMDRLESGEPDGRRR